MSWWISLNDDDGEPVTVENHEDGGTFVLGGTSRAELNVTDNYSDVFRAANLWDGVGLRAILHDKRASDVIPALEQGVERLGTHRYTDYWAPTPGNAGYALSILLGWARQYPDAMFEVS